MKKNVVIETNKIKTKQESTSLEKVQARAKTEMGKENFAMRSCWSCNPAHMHLKKVNFVIWCFGCGHYFYKGRDVTEK